jgi:hypothetical protein
MGSKNSKNKHKDSGGGKSAPAKASGGFIANPK